MSDLPQVNVMRMCARIEALETELAALKAPLPDEAAMIEAMAKAIWESRETRLHGVHPKEGWWEMQGDSLHNRMQDHARSALTALRPYFAAIRRRALSDAEKIALQDKWAECPYTNDKPGDPTWHHTEADICPVCRVPGGESDTTCVSAGRNRIAAAIRALIDQPDQSA